MTAARRWLRALAVGIFVAGMLTVIVPGTACACSCAVDPRNVSLASADVVFIGTPTLADKTEPAVSSADPVRWSFDVDTVHKGDVTGTVDVFSALDSASCGIPFVLNERYVVFGVVQDGVVTAALCGGTDRLDRIPAAELASLGAGSTPSAAPLSSPVASPPATNPAATSNAVATDGDSRRPLLIGTAVAAALILGIVLVLQRRRSRR